MIILINLDLKPCIELVYGTRKKNNACTNTLPAQEPKHPDNTYFKTINEKNTES